MILSEVTKVQRWGWSKGDHDTTLARALDLAPEDPVPPKFGDVYDDYYMTSVPVEFVKPKDEVQAKIQDDAQQVQAAERSYYIFGNKTAPPVVARPGLASPPMIKEGSGHFIGGQGNDMEVEGAMSRESRLPDLTNREGEMGVRSEFGPGDRQQIVIPQIMRGDDSSTGITVVRVN